MLNKNDFSPEELSCIEVVQKTPENQKQSVFEKACEKIKDKTKIAILALTLGLSQPALAWNTSTEKQQEQEKILNIYENDFLVWLPPQRANIYRKGFSRFPPEVKEILIELYIEWKSVIIKNNPNDLNNDLNRLKVSLSALAAKLTKKHPWWKEVVGRLFDDLPYLKNTTFWNKLEKLWEKIDIAWEKQLKYYEEVRKFRSDMAKKF